MNKNKSWSHDEEKKLVISLRGGLRFNKIGETLGRTDNAIKQRIKKIIYENIDDINNQNQLNKVSKSLNLDPGLVKSYYDSYKSQFDESIKNKQKSNSVDVEIPKNNLTNSINPDVQIGGAKTNIKRENEILNDILDNYELKKKIKKLLKEKKLDIKSKDQLKKLFLHKN